MHLLAQIAICLGALSLLVQAISPISIAGSKFFDANGNQFFIKGSSWSLGFTYAHSQLRVGIAYQLVENDPLANGQQCQLDALALKQLGANTIRVYHVRATADHTDCMNAFAENGIYVLVDLDSFYTYIKMVPTSGSWSWGFANRSRVVRQHGT